MTVDLKTKFRAIENSQAFVDIADAYSLLEDLVEHALRDAHSVIPDFEQQATIAAGTANVDDSPFEPRTQTVADGIFDDGL